jgi:hypothetical protein
MARGGRREGAGRKPGSVSRLDAEARKRAAMGLLPLDYILSVMRDEKVDRHTRIDAAKAAAPYCHARLANVEVTGGGGGPILTADVPLTDEDRAEAIMRILDRAKKQAA